MRFAHHAVDRVVDDSTVSDEEAGARRARIRAIRAKDHEPRVEFARIGIQQEHEAYLVEATVVDVMRRSLGPRLTNAVRGRNADHGYISLEDLQTQLLAPFLDTDLPAILIRLGWWSPGEDAQLSRQGHGYYHGMSNKDLYHSTRGWWRIDTERAQDYPRAVAVFQGVTRAVYRINHSSWRRTRNGERVAFEGRRMHSGPVFDAFIGERGKRVPPQRATGNAVFGTASPIAYWP